MEKNKKREGISLLAFIVTAMGMLFFFYYFFMVPLLGKFSESISNSPAAFHP